MGYRTRAIACLFGATSLLWITLDNYALAPAWLVGSGLTGTALLVAAAIRMLLRQRYYAGRRVAIVIGATPTTANASGPDQRDRGPVRR